MDPLETSHRSAPLRDLSNVGGEALLPAVDGRSLIRLLDSLVTETVSLQSLAGVTASDLLRSRHGEHPDRVLIKELACITKLTMGKMNREYPGIPPDSIQKTIDLVSKPGAVTILLKGIVPGSRDLVPSILGYAVIFQGEANFPDREHIPEHLRSAPGATRFIRFFVTNEARELMPRGEAANKLLDEVLKVAGSGPCIGMILTDMVQTKGVPGRSKEIWLDAMRALSKRGFEDTGIAVSEEFSHKGGQAALLSFKWWVWPPTAGKTEQSDFSKSRFAALRRGALERLASTASAIPPIDGRVVVSSAPADTFDLARTFPGTLFVGATFVPNGGPPVRRERAANLLARQGDVVGQYLPDGSADAAIVLGVLPDIGGIDPVNARANIGRYLRSQAQQLRLGGTLVVRDTVAPEIDGSVVIEFTDPGSKTDLAALFRRFVAERRESHISEREWNQVIEHHGVGHARFQAPARVVQEFRLKVPYIDDWATEQGRSFTLESPSERRDLLTQSGLRLIFAGPEVSQWFVSKFLAHRIEISNLAGRRLPEWSTNYITIGQKVASDEGVKINPVSERVMGDAGYLTLRAFQQINPVTGTVESIREVAGRPGMTHDVIPYTIFRDRLYVRGREYPRPIIQSHGPHLDGSRYGGYITEQIAVEAHPKEFATEESRNSNALRAARERGGLIGVEGLQCETPTRYWLRPDSVDEYVVAQAVCMPDELSDAQVAYQAGGLFGKHKVRMFDGERVLQGCQVGSIPDARMERKIYELLIKHQISRGPWLGAQVELSIQDGNRLAEVKIDALISPPKRTVFHPTPHGEDGGFLERRLAEYEEVGANGQPLGRATLEYVAPGPGTGFSLNAVPVLPIARVSRNSGPPEIWVALECFDFPAVQQRSGSSALTTIPTFRIPQGISDLPGTEEYVKSQLIRDYGVSVKQMTRLGGKYFSSPGITPEVMYPYLAEMDLTVSDVNRFNMVPLNTLVPHIQNLKCAQAITALYRAAHALERS